MPYARKDTITWEAGRYYHFYNRGARQLTIFREETNYLFVLSRLKKYRRELNIAIIVYCLLPNHYHFLVRQDGDQPAGLLPQRVFNSYSKAYNNHYNHSGTLFEHRFEARPVDSERYLRHLCRYIHANPAKHGLVQRPEEWPYSNYPDWLGQRNGTLVDRQFVADFFPDPAAYQEFVTDYLIERTLIDELKYLED
ncbi:MAG: transposase [Chloroflexi bacterium]|nr:transposase [Chloroflexota bacterium]MCI0577977.1 transposase [Chloroflexota bacterium]MCI0646659.1 transposase [Chloroflexota bacterium]MCI0729239.1 transposase [Chloroflexota bacterium]